MSIISLICDEPSHPRPILVSSLGRHVTNGLWFEVRAPEVQPKPGRIRAGTRLDGQRDRFRFECRRCGLNAEVTDRRLAAVLTPLGDAGVTQLTLRGLVTTLANLGGHSS
jgi:hypothetical protein